MLRKNMNKNNILRAIIYLSAYHIYLYIQYSSITVLSSEYI